MRAKIPEIFSPLYAQRDGRASILVVVVVVVVSVATFCFSLLVRFVRSLRFSISPQSPYPFSLAIMPQLRAISDVFAQTRRLLLLRVL